MSGGSIGDPLGVAARILYRQAYTHSVAVIFAYSENPSEDEPPVVHGGSGALIDFEGLVCVITCDHVLRGYEILKSNEPRYRFQIGQQHLELDHVRDRDEVLDLASIDVTGLDLEALGNRSDGGAQALRPTRWPNPPVRPGEIVVVCGFPADTRELDSADRTIISVAFPFVDHVMEVDDDCFRITFDRSAWVSTEDDSAAPEWVARTDLGGMSGSPVFARRDLGGVAVLEFVGTLVSVAPFVPSEGVLIRSSRRLTPDGRISRDAVCPTP
jgi:hypothetical protein